MAIHYNDNYRSAYQHLQKTLDRLSRFSERKEPQWPAYDCDVLAEKAGQSYDETNQTESSLDKAINERSVHSLDQLAEVRVNTFTDSPHIDSEAAQKITTDSQFESNMRSFWVSVSDTEQWHVKEFLPVTEDSVVGIKHDHVEPHQLQSILASYLDRTAILMHGEFGSSRCFYNEQGAGLAWQMAEQGYHVFAIDMSGRKRCPSISQQQPILKRLKSLLQPSADSRFLREYLPRTIQACGKRGVAVAVKRLEDQLGSSGLDESQKSNLNAELHRLQYTENLSGAPRVWIAHGFGAAWLAAAWARMSESGRQAKQMVFFEGYRFWQGGSVLSKSLAKILSARFSRVIVNALGKFPVRSLALGSADEPTQMFDVYSKWISADEWVDPEDGFNYQLALQENPLPPVLHIMNESENCLVPGSAVRRFSNELAPQSADLIGIPTSLKAIARDISEATNEVDDATSSILDEPEIPVFSYSGMLLHPDARDWIFSPMLQWLESTSSIAGQPMSAQVPDDSGAVRQPELNKQEPAINRQMDLSDFIPTPA